VNEDMTEARKIAGKLKIRLGLFAKINTDFTDFTDFDS
jgi:hypothetical protein